MAQSEVDEWVESLFFPKMDDERIDARIDLGAEEPTVIRNVFDGFVRYIRAIVTGAQAPHPSDVTPLAQLQSAFQPIQNLLIGWHLEEASLVETLSELAQDPNPKIRALAAVALGGGNLLWKDDARVNEYLHLLQHDAYALVRAAANYGLEYAALGEKYQAGLRLDTSVQQRLEQYAAQVMSGLAKQSS